jgi:hypothetical protein
MLIGILMLVSVLRALRSPRSSHNVFRRSSTTVRAKVLERKTETHTSWDEYTGTSTYRIYKVIVRFDAVRSGAAVEQVTLEARVSKRLYDRLSPGTEVTVRYATEDPCLAFLEGEAEF